MWRHRGARCYVTHTSSGRRRCLSHHDSPFDSRSLPANSPRTCCLSSPSRCLTSNYLAGENLVSKPARPRATRPGDRRPPEPWPGRRTRPWLCRLGTVVRWWWCQQSADATAAVTSPPVAEVVSARRPRGGAVLGCLLQLFVRLLARPVLRLLLKTPPSLAFAWSALRLVSTVFSGQYKSPLHAHASGYFIAADTSHYIYFCLLPTLYTGNLFNYVHLSEPPRRSAEGYSDSNEHLTHPSCPPR